MASKELGYQVVYRGETLPHLVEGGWVFFQRLKEYGGGYWLGRTYHDVFILEYDRPTSLYDGILFIFEMKRAEHGYTAFDDDFTLT
ncbi:Uncharacterised protein [Serratia liquefaciens]|uniref:hypothetical protein n=1 Tax=Serratia liquefaciens TaxID=614 RepID=UPI002183D304|nr:hypothetical protein [Serratia liquefaciens]CAI2442738.1 Uncharacterised protein [Serratia liquefaciens]